MPNLQELLAQRAELEKLINSTQTAERTEAIAKVKSLMSEYNLSIADISKNTRGAAATGSGIADRRASKGSKVAAKFKDPATGSTWSGRGLQPKWLKAAIADGKKIGDFAI